MADLIKQGAFSSTKQLDARDWTVDPHLTGGPIPIVSTPVGFMAELHGRVIGLAGEYAMFAYSVNSFQSAPPTNGYLDSVEIVPTGDRFRIWLNQSQTLYALGSVSPSVSWGSAATVVFVTFNVHFVTLQEILEDGKPPPSTGPGDGGSGGPGEPKVTGPGPFWRKY